MMNTIKFRKTVVGWYNFTICNFMVYNTDPTIFRKYAGVSEQATLGTCEINAEDLKALRMKSKFIGLAPGWEWVPIDEEEAEAL